MAILSGNTLEIVQHIALFSFAIIGWLISKAVNKHLRQADVASKLEAKLVDPTEASECASTHPQTSLNHEAEHAEDVVDAHLPNAPIEAADGAEEHCSSTQDCTQQSGASKKVPSENGASPTTASITTATTAATPTTATVTVEPEAEAQPEQPEQSASEPSISDRVARILAKKAQRKARKALELQLQKQQQEQQQQKEQEQLEVEACQSLVQDIVAADEEAGEEETQQEAKEDPKEEGSEKDRSLPKSIRSFTSTSTATSTTLEMDDETRTSSKEGSTSGSCHWADIEEDCDWVIKANKQLVQSEEVPESPQCEPPTQYNQPAEQYDGTWWPEVWTSMPVQELPVLPAEMGSFQPVWSETGEQYYTDGQDYYMLAGVEMVPGGDFQTEVPMFRATVDPNDPMHHSYMNMAIANMIGMNMDQGMMQEEEEDNDDAWNTCWGSA